MQIRRLAVLQLTAGFLLLLAVGAGVPFAPVARGLGRSLALGQEVGGWEALLLAAAYVPVSVLFVRRMILALVTGFVLELPAGIVVVSTGSTAGATAAFLVGRMLPREWLITKVARNEHFHRIDLAAEREGSPGSPGSRSRRRSQPADPTCEGGTASVFDSTR